MRFKDEGYRVIKGVLDASLIENLKYSLHKNLAECALDLSCKEEEYLSVVSRWVHPSPVTSSLYDHLVPLLQEKAAELVGESVQLKKFNVIGKNVHCPGAIAFHQDISYSPQCPYQFSAWVALNDVHEEDGPLEVVPGSHRTPILPAVDFWSPDYQPNHDLISKAVKVPIQAGDAIFFDSRLWHGSQESRSLSPRYAIVLRFTSDSWNLKEQIPPIQPLPFGMWTCGQETEKMLQQYFGKADFMSLLEKGIASLSAYPRVVEALKKIRILSLAALRHNGGDSTGTIYKNFWYTWPLT